MIGEVKYVNGRTNSLDRDYPGVLLEYDDCPSSLEPKDVSGGLLDFGGAYRNARWTFTDCARKHPRC